MECKGKCPFCTEPCPWDHCSWKNDDTQEKKTEYKKPNPEALDEMTNVISDLHGHVPSDEFIQSIEDSDKE